MKQSTLTRRGFLAGTAAVVAGCATKTKRAPAVISTRSPNEKLNVAAIGLGAIGKGDISMMGFKEEQNVVALCDVDFLIGATAFNWWPDAPRYKDFREMLDKEKSIDAVTVSTPDHAHIFAALYAMALGKHVYVQKPLTHSIHEARVLLDASRKYKVATQMGNQGHSFDDVRGTVEMIRAGAIGDVKEVHCWTDRPGWPQGIRELLPGEPVPDHLDWDRWIGPAPMHPYNQLYTPTKWRGWWDFGCGALGDMGCHIMDPAFWALALSAPTSVECLYQEDNNELSGPTKSKIKYEFPARKGALKMPPVTMYWYDGGLLPPRPEGIAPDVMIAEGDQGTLFIGTKGMLCCGMFGDKARLLPEAADKDYTRPAPYLPRVENPYKDWIQACKGVRPACSSFEYSVPLTETVLLGNVAIRAGQKIVWDADKARITNAPEANKYLQRQYRPGWNLPAL